MKQGLFPLFERRGRFSLSAFWFSVTMAVSLGLVTAATVRLLVWPDPLLLEGLPGLAALIGVPNAILAGVYAWGGRPVVGQTAARGRTRGKQVG